MYRQERLAHLHMLASQLTAISLDYNTKFACMVSAQILLLYHTYIIKYTLLVSTVVLNGRDRWEIIWLSENFAL